MPDRQDAHKKGSENSASGPKVKSQFQSRPFALPAQSEEASLSQQETPDLQTQLDRARRLGPNLSRVKVKAQPSGGNQPQPLGRTIQRQDQQVEQIRPPKPLGRTIQRQDQQVEQIRPPKPLGRTIQRQDQQVAQIEPPKPLGRTIQRQDQQVAQIGPTNPLPWTIQRQDQQQDKEVQRQPIQPKLAQSVEIVPQQEQSSSAGETSSEARAEGRTNPATQAVQAVNPQQQVQLPSEVQAQAEGKQTQGGEQAQGKDGNGKVGEEKSKALEQVPQAQALKEATAQNQVAIPKSEGRGEAANLPAEAENQQSKAVAEQGKAQLEATNAQAQQLASAGVNFAPPEEEQAGQVAEGPVIAMKAETPGSDAAALKERSARASSIASGFVATASGKVQAITGLGTGIPARIQGASENAKARVMAGVEQQKAAVTAHITQQRAKAQSEAQATIAKIQAQYQATIGAIPGETAKAREKVSAEYATSVKVVDALEKGQITQIEGIYTRAGSEFRNAGARVGDEAVRNANQKASEYKSRDSGAAQVASFLGLGAVSDVAFGTETLKNKARAQAAESVGQEYKKALIAKGEECAKQAEQGKQKDIDTVRQTAAKSRETLQTQQKAAIDSLNTAEQQAKQQAQQAQTQLTQTAKQSLEATLTSLDQQQATQLQMLTSQGQQQVAAIEGSAEKAIASLQNAINQSASGLRGTLQRFQAQAKTAQAPNPDALSAAVGQVQGQIDAEIGKIRAQVEQGIAASVQSITQSGQQSVEGLNSIGQGAIESATTLSQGLTTTMTGLAQSATDTFKQIQQAHTKTTAETATTAVDGFKKVTEGIEKTFEEMSKGLESQFQQHVKEVEKALQGALNDLPAVINEEAEKAAAQVDPKKELLKLVVIVAVVVVAALVVGPFAAGLLAPLGAMGTILAGAAVGALSGAVIQMASNAIDGKNILEGVVQAALGGAIGGALGAGIGMAVGGALRGAAGNVANRLGERAGSGLRSAGNFALDVAEETIGDIATNIATGQFSWDSIGESLLFSVFGAGLSRSGAGQRISDGAQNRGTQISNHVSDRVGNVFGGSTDDRTPIDVSTPGKPSGVDETTPADKTPSSQSGDHSPIDVSTPDSPPQLPGSTLGDTKPQSDIDSGNTPRATDEKGSDRATHEPPRSDSEVAATAKQAETSGQPPKLESGEASRIDADLDIPSNQLTDAELMQATTPTKVGEADHSVIPRRIGDEVQLWVCSHACGRANHKIDDMIGKIDSTHANSPNSDAQAQRLQDLRNELEQLKTEVGEAEKDIEAGMASKKIIDRTGEIARKLNELGREYNELGNGLNSSEMITEVDNTLLDQSFRKADNVPEYWQALGVTVSERRIVNLKEYKSLQLERGGSYLYVLRDTSGSVLKVGLTEGDTVRFGKYNTAAEVMAQNQDVNAGLQLELEVARLETLPQQLAKYEGKLREWMEARGHIMPWDNSTVSSYSDTNYDQKEQSRLGDSRLGYPRQGTPYVTKPEAIARGERWDIPTFVGIGENRKFNTMREITPDMVDALNRGEGIDESVLNASLKKKFEDLRDRGMVTIANGRVTLNSDAKLFRGYFTGDYIRAGNEVPPSLAKPGEVTMPPSRVDKEKAATLEQLIPLLENNSNTTAKSVAQQLNIDESNVGRRIKRYYQDQVNFAQLKQIYQHHKEGKGLDDISEIVGVSKDGVNSCIQDIKRYSTR